MTPQGRQCCLAGSTIRYPSYPKANMLNISRSDTKNKRNMKLAWVILGMTRFCCCIIIKLDIINNVPFYRLQVVKQCCATDGVEATYIKEEILPEFFKNFWTHRMALDRRNYRQVCDFFSSLLHCFFYLLNLFFSLLYDILLIYCQRRDSL